MSIGKKSDQREYSSNLEISQKLVKDIFRGVFPSGRVFVPHTMAKVYAEAGLGK